MHIHSVSTLPSSPASGEAQPAATPAASPQQPETVIAAAVYSSPKMAWDAASGLFIVQIRDSGSGAVLQQIPDARIVKEYRMRSLLGLTKEGKTTIG